MSRPRCCALVVAAGSGSRFGGPKQYADLLGQPVLRWTVQALRAHEALDSVRVVIGDGHRALYHAATAGLDLPPPIVGGAERQDSVLRGLEALADDPPEAVLIHDAARPLVDRGAVDRVVAALERHDGAIAALPTVDSLHRGGADGRIVEGVARDGLWQAQTPQGFRFAPILAAHRAATGRRLTDDAAVARAAGLAVALVEGHRDMFKITAADDLPRAAALLAGRFADIRTGSGFDVHRLIPGDGVTLCNVRIPCDLGVEAHSDGDVALHALTDALLGTIGAGDIGQHFPPSDPQWRDADSAAFVRHALGLVAARGGVVANADITIVCERPRIGPHREAMAARLRDILGIAADRIGLKATTSERLGFTGRGEGLMAQAVVTVRLPG
ncbi:MAG TPA: bifunctional 2-C-methyl-D-erythritol 4-phosphate cytidylyltransferase/2-C-methyl-D-erythritol 2,4-cyclodiphosphate synthase [Alphaproteobacteria bacterium]|nr:bifunctional 2-C-methyl-D-erythritol 4-phosphate cytidylyltransferase/2-C-methyl-D-erythritol 2,4-cyclodiphosphate synthase [Alphaproteobacteria bacterium]